MGVAKKCNRVPKLGWPHWLNPVRCISYRKRKPQTYIATHRKQFDMSTDRPSEWMIRSTSQMVTIKSKHDRSPHCRKVAATCCRCSVVGSCVMCHMCQFDMSSNGVSLFVSIELLAILFDDVLLPRCTVLSVSRLVYEVLWFGEKINRNFLFFILGQSYDVGWS